MSDWRQAAYNVRQLKRLWRAVQNKKRSKAQSDELKAKNEAAITQAHEEFLTLARQYVAKAQQTLIMLQTNNQPIPEQSEIEKFIQHATRQIDQIQRRVLDGESIAHSEKVFSIFEPHTEWVSKGKPGVPVEFGLKVCILEDQHQFILHHRVMQKQTDDQVAVSMVSEAKERFASLNACSFDKGFHSPTNQEDLKALLGEVTLPRKGKLSAQARAVEKSESFIKARHAHSAVESAINALDVHGLDKCPDHGIEGFKRYVAFAIVARNIHRIGAILWQQEHEQVLRKRKRDERATPFKKAA
jgi:transposase, IS5 family